MGDCGGKILSSISFSISGLHSGKGGDGGTCRSKGSLRLLYLQSNSFSSLLFGIGAPRSLYLRSSSSSLLLYLRLLNLQCNSSPSLLLSSLTSKLILLLSSLLSILFFNLSSLV